MSNDEVVNNFINFVLSNNKGMENVEGKGQFTNKGKYAYTILSKMNEAPQKKQRSLTSSERWVKTNAEKYNEVVNRVKQKYCSKTSASDLKEESEIMEK